MKIHYRTLHPVIECFSTRRLNFPFQFQTMQHQQKRSRQMCTICGTSVANLVRHRTEMHSQKDQVYECRICGHHEVRYEQLERHYFVRHQAKPDSRSLTKTKVPTYGFLVRCQNCDFKSSHAQHSTAPKPPEQGPRTTGGSYERQRGARTASSGVHGAGGTSTTTEATSSTATSATATGSTGGATGTSNSSGSATPTSAHGDSDDRIRALRGGSPGTRSGPSSSSATGDHGHRDGLSRASGVRFLGSSTADGIDQKASGAGFISSGVSPGNARYPRGDGDEAYAGRRPRQGGTVHAP